MATDVPSRSATRTRATGGRRRALIDRETVKPALLVLALAVLMSVVLPQINRETPYRDPVHRGQIVELADGITLVPAVGWDLATGALVGHTRSSVGQTATTELVNGSINVDVQTAPFAGGPSALLSRVEKISDELHHARGRAPAGPRYSVTTRSGIVGVGQDFGGVNRQGSVVAFVISAPRPVASRPGSGPAREGIEIVVAGPRGSILRQRGDIVAMIRSIRVAS